MKLPHLRSEQIKNQPDQTAALINRLVDEVEKKGSGGGGGGTSDFNELTNRPSYGNVTMTGSTNIPIVPTKTSQLVNDSDFATLSDIPTKTSELINDSDFATVSQIPTKTSQLINDSDFVDSTDLATAIANHDSDPNAHSDIRDDVSDIEDDVSDIQDDVTDLQNDVSAIQDIIPNTATSSNKLTDKNYVDDSINSVTAYYITKNAQGDPFATKAELLAATTFYSGGEVRVPTRNDYCIVVADESQRDPITGEDPTTRYIYNNGWEFQYIVNKTALTADQLAALNSGITASDVTKLDGIEAGAEVNVQADWAEADNTSDAYIQNKPSIPTKTSDLANDGSDGTSTYVEANELATVATTGDYDDLLNKPSIPDEMVELSYGHSTWNDFITAYNTHTVVYCKASSNSNPGTGSQTRKAFMAYVNNDTNPTQVEFQYYRSVSSHTDAQQGDQVFIYLLTSANGGTWSVTTRNAFSKVVAGSNMTSSYSSGTITLNATVPTKTSDLTNDGSDGTSTYVEASDLATVATSGSYTDLSNKPTIPVVNDATLTITQNGTTAGTFTANSATPTTVALTDTTYSDFEGATSSVAGASGLVPQPAAGDNTKFLAGDGTWKIVSSGTTYSAGYGIDSTELANYDTIAVDPLTIAAKTDLPTKTSDLTNDGSDGTSFYPDWSAVATALGDKQNVLTAGSNITIDNTDPDNPVISATGGAQAVFCWGSIPDGTMKDSTDTTTVTGQAVYDACVAGQVIIKAKDVKPNHYDEVVSYVQQNTDYKFSVSFKDGTTGERVLREYVYSSGAWSSNEINVQEELSNATTTTDGTMSAADKTNLDNLVNGFADKVDVPNDNIDNYNGTLLDLVKGIYPENYHRWGTTTDSATANISDKPTGATNRGFVLEAYLSRNVDASDYSYRLVCWSDRYSTVYTTYVRTSTQSITWEKLIDTTSVGEVTPTMLENGEYYDMLGPIYGTTIPNSANLNTLAYLNVGIYCCNTSATAATLTNCPTASAFTMRVYSSHSPVVQDPATDTWVYIVREITDFTGHRWVQNSHSGATAGTFNYGAWKRCLESDQVLSATVVRDAGWNADKDKIPDMSFMAYWNGAYSGTSSNLQYFKNNSVTTANIQDGAITSAKLAADAVSKFGCKYLSGKSGTFTTSNVSLGSVTLSAGTYILTVGGMVDFGSVTSTGAHIYAKSGSATGTTVVEARAWSAGGTYSVNGSVVVTPTANTNYYLTVQADKANIKYSYGFLTAVRIA